MRVGGVRIVGIDYQDAGIRRGDGDPMRVRLPAFAPQASLADPMGLGAWQDWVSAIGNAVGGIFGGRGGSGGGSVSGGSMSNAQQFAFCEGERAQGRYQQSCCALHAMYCPPATVYPTAGGYGTTIDVSAQASQAQLSQWLPYIFVGFLAILLVSMSRR